jgi:DNA-binding PadR family transcriptional regulator
VYDYFKKNKNMQKGEYMKFLTKHEELFMLTIFRLNKPATLTDIRDHLLNNTGKDLAFASLYLTLEKLYQKGYVSSEVGDPSPVRGGKALKYYHLTNKGMTALKAEKELKDRMWKGFPSPTQGKKVGNE